MDERTRHTLLKISRTLWCSLAVWALVAVTPLFMILRELVGPGREAFNIGIVILPLAIVGVILVIGLIRKTSAAV